MRSSIFRVRVPAATAAHVARLTLLARRLPGRFGSNVAGIAGGQMQSALCSQSSLLGFQRQRHMRRQAEGRRTALLDKG